MAIDWKTVIDGYSKIGVDWNGTLSDDGKSITYQPVTYLDYATNSGEEYLEYRWSLKLDGVEKDADRKLLATQSYNSTNTAVNGGNAFTGTKVIYSKHSPITVEKKSYSQALTLKLDCGDLFGGWGSGKTFGGLDEGGYWTNTWTLTVDALPTYEIVFDPNGGDGGPDRLIKMHGADLLIPSEIPIRTNYKFMGWDTEQDGSGWRKQPGESITGNESKTMYAIWELAMGIPQAPSIKFFNLTNDIDSREVRYNIHATVSSELEKIDRLYCRIVKNSMILETQEIATNLTSNYSSSQLTYWLDDNSVYEFQVWAENEAGKSAVANSKFFSKPASPKLLSLIRCREKGETVLKINLSLAHIASNNRKKIYVLAAASKPSFSIKHYLQTISNDVEIITIPEPGSTYAIDVYVRSTEEEEANDALIGTGISSDKLRILKGDNDTPDTESITVHNLYFKDCGKVKFQETTGQVKFYIPE